MHVSAETEQEQKKYFLTEKNCYNYKEYRLQEY